METGRVVYQHPSWTPVSRLFVAEALGVPPFAWLHPWDEAPQDKAERAFNPAHEHGALYDHQDRCCELTTAREGACVPP